jgi:hypothetical protein
VEQNSVSACVVTHQAQHEDCTLGSKQAGVLLPQSQLNLRPRAQTEHLSRQPARPS